MTGTSVKTLLSQIFKIIVLLYVFVLARTNYLIGDYFFSGASVVTLLMLAYNSITTFSQPNYNRLGNFAGVLILLTFNTPRNYHKYQVNVCMGSFGKEFNGKRRQLGIPIIPADWMTKLDGYPATFWEPAKKGRGHNSKYVSSSDTGCQMEFERDDYDLRSVDSLSRYISIYYIYANKKHPDTLRYSYTAHDSTRTISRATADSIFAAEHIQKDY